MSPDAPRAHALPSIPADDSPSPAEVAFLERVRTDRERARTLRRRALITAAASIAAIGAWFATSGLPRWQGAEVSTAPAAPLLPDILPAGGTLEQRIAGLEARLGALEDRAAQSPAGSGAQRVPVTGPPTRRSPKLRTAAPPPGDVKAASVASARRVPVVTTVRQPVRRQTTTQELTLGERVRRGWGAVERQVRRTPDEVREGFARVGRLFAD